MPRLPVDGKRVIEHRITLGGKERELLESWVAAKKVSLVVDSDVMDVLSDPVKVIAFVEAIATALELIGIETPIPTPVDAWEFIEKVKNDPQTIGREYGTDVRDWRVFSREFWGV
jgi:hypothetical protein